MADYLAYNDPRLLISPSVAALGDGATRAALRVLTDALSPRLDQVVSAPAFGLPVRLIASRRGDEIQYLLNPKLIEAAEFVRNIGETSPHTGPVRRNTLRAKRVLMVGTGLGGEQQILKVEDRQAFEAQMALDLMESPNPFDWITPYHSHWLRHGAGYFEAVNAGLYSAQSEGILRFDDLNRVTLHLAGADSALCTMDALNPMIPVIKRHRRLLALISVLTPLKNLYLAEAENLPVLLGGLLVSGGLKVFGPENLLPGEVLTRLGIAPAYRSLALSGLISGSVSAEGGAAFDAVMFDRVASPSAPIPTQSNLRQIAKNLDGMSGTFLIAMPGLDSNLEQDLQAVFPHVFAFPSAEGEVIYTARKSWEGESAIRARIISGDAKSGTNLVDTLSEPWIHLRKDGERQPL